MTSAAKFDQYELGLLGLSFAFGTTEECAESAGLSRIVKDEGPLAA